MNISSSRDILCLRDGGRLDCVPPHKGIFRVRKRNIFFGFCGHKDKGSLYRCGSISARSRISIISLWCGSRAARSPHQTLRTQGSDSHTRSITPRVDLLVLPTSNPHRRVLPVCQYRNPDNKDSRSHHPQNPYPRVIWLHIWEIWRFVWEEEAA